MEQVQQKMETERVKAAQAASVQNGSAMGSPRSYLVSPPGRVLSPPVRSPPTPAGSSPRSPVIVRTNISGWIQQQRHKSASPATSNADASLSPLASPRNSKLLAVSETPVQPENGLSVSRSVLRFFDDKIDEDMLVVVMSVLVEDIGKMLLARHGYEGESTGLDYLRTVVVCLAVCIENHVSNPG